MALPKFTAVTRSQGANIALKDGRVQPKTFSFDFIEVDPLIAAFRRQVRAANPGLAADCFEAFAQAKRLYVDDLKAGKIEKPDTADRLHKRVMEVIGDPMPYGIEPNRKIIETLMGHAQAQGIINSPMKVEDLFARETWNLVG